jgi:polysaccharide export outer membrane protein
MRKQGFPAVMAALLLTLNACATKEPIELQSGQEMEIIGVTFERDMARANFEVFPEYLIQSGDVLDVLFQFQTWLQMERFEISVDHTVSVKFPNNPEFNEEQRVRPDGSISLPYVGEYYVVGKTVGEIQDELTEQYSQELRDPELYVVIPEFREAIQELKRDLHTAPRGLSRLVTVRPDGRVTFPMVGEMKVFNRTIAAVEEELNLHYDGLMPGLHVDLFLEKHTGSMVYVLGEVNKPGAYPISKPINLLQALSLAAGYKSSARLDSVVVVRRYGQKLLAKRVDLEQMLSFRAGQSLFYLAPDDIVLIPESHLSYTAEIMSEIMKSLMFRGWGVNFDTTEIRF